MRQLIAALTLVLCFGQNAKAADTQATQQTKAAIDLPLPGTQALEFAQCTTHISAAKRKQIKCVAFFDDTFFLYNEGQEIGTDFQRDELTLTIALSSQPAFTHAYYDQYSITPVEDSSTEFQRVGGGNSNVDQVVTALMSPVLASKLRSEAIIKDHKGLVRGNVESVARAGSEHDTKTYIRLVREIKRRAGQALNN